MTTNPDTIQLDDLAQNPSTAVVITSLAQQATTPRLLDEGIYGILAEGAVQIVETPGYKQQREHSWLHEHADTPEFVHRQVTALNVDSFVDYLARNTAGEDIVEPEYAYGAGELELWANIEQRRIIAILDGGNGLRKHTATLQVSTTPDWDDWVGIDGKLLQQTVFAEFIEDHLSSIADPDGATLLDICQTLTAKTGVNFKSSDLLANGQRQLVYEETVETRAGTKGNLKVPTELVLFLAPFQGGQPVQLNARFRYRIFDGVLGLGVKLVEPRNILQGAFDAVIEDVQQQVPVHINHGRG